MIGQKKEKNAICPEKLLLTKFSISKDPRRNVAKHAFGLASSHALVTGTYIYLVHYFH